MRASIFNHRRVGYGRVAAWWVALALGLVAAVGCSDENTGGGEAPGGVVDIELIILNPKAAQPGDTVTATVVLDGSVPPGTFPSVAWSASGGSFLTDDETTVDWVAPPASGVYRLTCRVTTGSNTDQLEADVFVGTPEIQVVQDAGEIRLAQSPPDFYYLNSIPDGVAWDSSSVYLKTTGIPAPVVSSQRVGAEFSFSKTLKYAAFVVDDSTDAVFTEDALNVYVVDLAAGTQRRITRDRSFPDGTRRHQYRYPRFSPDENWVTYQGLLPNPQAGSIDTLDVFVYDLLTDEETNVTAADTTSSRRRNTYPSYSTDSAWLVFVADRAVRDQWDLFGQPVTNGVVDIDPQSTTQLTTGGLIGLGPIETLGVPKFEWNPVQPILAVVGGGGSDGGLHLVQTSGSGATTTDVTELGTSVVEFTWSDDGQVLAASALVPAADGGGTVGVVYSVTPAGVATLRHTAVAGDRIVDLAWSPDARFLVYRVIRGAISWLELLDVDAGTNFLDSVVITSSTSLGARNAYAAVMSTASRFDSNDTVYFIRFDGEGSPNGTPTIWTLDVSGAVSP